MRVQRNGAFASGRISWHGANALRDARRRRRALAKNGGSAWYLLINTWHVWHFPSLIRRRAHAADSGKGVASIALASISCGGQNHFGRCAWQRLGILFPRGSGAWCSGRQAFWRDIHALCRKMCRMRVGMPVCVMEGGYGKFLEGGGGGRGITKPAREGRMETASHAWPATMPALPACHATMKKEKASLPCKPHPLQPCHCPSMVGILPALYLLGGGGGHLAARQACLTATPSPATMPTTNQTQLPTCLPPCHPALTIATALALPMPGLLVLILPPLWCMYLVLHFLAPPLLLLLTIPACLVWPATVLLLAACCHLLFFWTGTRTTAAAGLCLQHVSPDGSILC